VANQDDVSVSVDRDTLALLVAVVAIALAPHGITGELDAAATFASTFTSTACRCATPPLPLPPTAVPPPPSPLAVVTDEAATVVELVVAAVADALPLSKESDATPRGSA
jgi:hypothetical protein